MQKEWQSHPETENLLKWLNDQVVKTAESMGNGGTLCGENEHVTQSLTARYVGKIEAYKEVIDNILG